MWFFGICRLFILYWKEHVQVSHQDLPFLSQIQPARLRFYLEHPRASFTTRRRHPKTPDSSPSHLQGTAASLRPPTLNFTALRASRGSRRSISTHLWHGVSFILQLWKWAMFLNRSLPLLNLGKMALSRHFGSGFVPLWSPLVLQNLRIYSQIRLEVHQISRRLHVMEQRP